MYWKTAIRASVWDLKVRRSMTARFRDEAAQTNTSLEVHASASLIGEWDSHSMDQIISNLVSNALKFGAGKPVVVSATSDGNSARIQVRDSGIGIALEDQARIFQRFERAVPLRHFGGFGLGLWIVHRAVKALGGTISVESEPGRGATVTVELPLRQSQREQGDSSPLEDSSRPPAS